MSDRTPDSVIPAPSASPTPATEGGARRRILLYGDVNLNIIDGSAIWLASMAETLASTGSEIHVALKSSIVTDRLVRRMRNFPNVVVHEARPAPGEESMSTAEAVQRLEQLDAELHADVVLVRGIRACQNVVASTRLAGRLWCYVTEIPFPATRMSKRQRGVLRSIAEGSKRLFVQTEDTRAYLESILPAAAGKTLIMTPIIPDDFFRELHPAQDGSGPLRLVYSGKFAPDWRTLEMTDLPKLLADHGVAAELTMIGDKFHEDANYPEWTDAMRAALEDRPGLNWVGGMAREDALAEVARAEVGLSWRSPALDASLEISTKVLEYAASGVPPLLNRTASHEALFGPDYPLMIEQDDPAEVVRVLEDVRPRLAEVRQAAQDAVRPYQGSVRAARLEEYFRHAEADFTLHARRPAPLKVLVASHDLKFAGELVGLLETRPDIELRFDRWETLHKHDERQSKALLKWADVVICEWAGPNSVWYSTHKRPGQKLVVRLHMFELGGPWLENIKFDAVDTLVTVSELYQNLTAEQTGWDPEKIVVIPNAIDVADLARPKVPGALYRLGIVGIVPFRKRPDRALDLLEALLEHDERFTLHIKGRLPWEYVYEWKKPEQQEAYLRFFDRLGTTPGLAEHVAFEPFGADMANWLRKIGFVLSPSTAESFHLAPAEGMASGSLPVLWERPGVRGIFGDNFVVDDTSHAARMVMSHVRDAEAREAAVEDARRIADSFDQRVVNNLWLDRIFPE